MEILHPSLTEPTAVPCPPAFPFNEPPTFATSAVRKALHGFVLGSAGGISRLTPKHLLDMAAYSGSTALDMFSRVVARFVSGRLPPEAHEYFFGARLVALLKTDGGLRPIACGDVFRRLAAKLLCSAVAPHAKEYLSRRGQLGVAVDGGMDGITHAARRYAAACVTGGSDRAIFKADVKNAFNSCKRSDFLHVVEQQFPELYAYAIAAYARPTLLQFTDTFISSCSGVQQGDPLGPLLFSLALAAILENIDTDALELNAWYLDDGTVGGRTSAIRAFVDALVRVAREHDLVLNLSKCEIICHDQDLDRMRALFPDVPKLLPVSSFFLLGTPLGSEDNARSKVTEVADRSARRARLITALPDAVVASTLLRYTTGFCIGNFYARGVGTLARDIFSNIDDATMTAWEKINFPLDTNRRELARLPTNCGGLGLRRVAEHCGVAFIAATVTAHEYFPALLSQSALETISSSQDRWLTMPSSDSALLHFPSVVDTATRYLENGVSVAHGQRILSRELDKAAATALAPHLPEELRARAVSAECPHANAWLTPAPGSDAPRWLSPADWDTLVRRRFVLPVASEAVTCGNCLRQVGDVFGDHAVTCMQGPARWAIHNALRDETVKICQEALLAPIKEPNCFSTRERPDILLKFPGPAGRRLLVVVDVAMTTIASRRSSALAEAGGAATRYEQVKRDKYKNLAEEMGAELVPLIVDDAGAWGTSALPFWRRVCRQYAKRFDLSMAKATTSVMGAISSALMASVARAIRSSVAPRPSFLP